MATLADAGLTFTTLAHPAPASAETRAAVLANPGFGTNFTDHMVTIEWTEGQDGVGRWHDAVIGPRQPIPLDPAAAVLHYAQEIFEGLKAYNQADGAIALFRPEANAARFNQSAERLAMPALPESVFVEAIEKLVQIDRAWIPEGEGASLYLRPFMIATEAFLGVRPAKQYKFIVIASPAGNYFKSGAPAVSIWVSDYTRAAPGGTGAAKCGGNYAASLVPQAEAIARGHDQVVFLDAAEHKWIEELGGMNLYFAFEDGTLLTPELTGTILPGITRDSLLQLAREEGLTVTEGRYSLDQWRADAASGKLIETFACGTAAVVTSVGKVSGRDGDFTIGTGGPGQLTGKLKNRLVSIQRGEAPDTHGWIRKIG
ncbi:Branched-chain-amino-acid aminotransferase [Novosphingobium resinovorum]|uniref:Branched-chain-amino-acid aminotransferase n=1 Tax=Novosphingobium resinovorum TaxID=158500 RepID=A0A031K3H6_9SPHN|nr:branched-chain amino acid aminotransferase [Novosphingobium resinovorum]EZP83780.1 Branched-chain-amino-acid aminotransferase [Novosphingobium resinovorum]